MLLRTILILCVSAVCISIHAHASVNSFTEAQIVEIEQLQSDGNEERVSWGNVYDAVADMIKPNIDKNQELRSVWMWFGGAAKVNRGEGAFSTLIREYTYRQGGLHFGEGAEGFNATGMQEASDKVAKNAVSSIIKRARVDNDFSFPTIEGIAKDDAVAVGDTLFKSKNGDSVYNDNAAWSGTLLFPLLRSDQTGRLIERGLVKDGSMNTVEDFRNVIAAYDSFVVGGVNTYDEILSNDPFDWDDFYTDGKTIIETMDFSDKFSLLASNFFSQNGTGDLERTVGSFLTSILEKETAAESLDFVHHNRVNRLASQMYQMLLDKPSGEVTSVNRQSILNSSFNSLSGSSLLSSDVKLLKNYSESELSKLVESSRAFRYATERLSAFVFDTEGNSLASYQATDLDSDNFSKAYSYDRSHFLLQQVDAWLDDSIYATRGVLERGLKRAYLDYKTGTDLKTSNIGGYGSAFEIQEGIDTFIFGSSGSETIQAKSGMDRIYGDAGDDNLSGGDKQDYIDGGSGNDSLYGENDEDTLLGGKGDDTIEGGEGNDILDGGEGNDTYVFDDDSGTDEIYNFEDDKSDDTGVIKYNDKVITGAGAKRKSSHSNTYYNKDEEIRYFLVNENLTIQFESDGVVKSSVSIPKFTNGNLGITLPTDIDSLANSTNQSHIVSQSFGGVCGNAVPEGTQMLWLYSWDNVSEGDPCDRKRIDQPQLITNDTSYSGFILASGEDDRIIGNDQKEYLHGGLGEDYINAGGGDDLINGDLSLFGLGLVLNTPVGNIGNDWLEGGAGNDKIFGDSVFSHVPAAGDSADEYEYGSEAFQSFQLSYDPKTQNDTIFGQDGDDEIYGNLGNDYIDGGNGADVIYGGAHSDRIEAGDGDDFIYADADILIWMQQGDSNAYDTSTYLDEVKDQAGNDSVLGGAGDDYIATGSGNDLIYGGEGDDTIYADGSLNQVEESIDVEKDAKYNGEDLVYGGDGADKIWGFGNDDVIYGDGGNDLIWGDHDDLDESVHGKDIIHGGDGDDQIEGQAGDDRLFGDDGNDLISGGKGIDWIWGDNGDDELQGKEGNDQLFGGDDVDTLFGDEGNDLLDGGKGDDELIGGAGNDNLIGGSGLDYLYGGAGDDHLSGGDGDDVLQADTGNDYLSGGPGSDTLRGGVGNDTYLANFGDGETKIEDSLGANQIIFGAGIYFSSISVVVNDLGVFLDYGSGDSVFIESSSMGGAWTIGFASGPNVNLSYFLRDHTPKPSTVTQVALADGITPEQLSFMRENNSLLINYLPKIGSSLGLKSKSTVVKSSTQKTVKRSTLKAAESTSSVLQSIESVEEPSTEDSSEEWIDPAALADAGYIFSINTVEIEGVEYQQLSMTNWFNADSASYLNQLNLGSETIDLTNLPEVVSTYTGSNYADEIVASSDNDEIFGLSAADTIEAKEGNDRITGGTGNDQIAGGIGDDLYLFSAGDGVDVLFDEKGNDSIIFSEAISLADLSVEEKANGLLIRINTTDDEGVQIKDAIFILGWFQNPDAKIESVQFADNSQLTSEELEGMITGNRSPIANTSIATQTATLGQAFSFSLPNNLFSDPNPDDDIEIRAFKSEGGLLDSWLHFDQDTQTFSGTPGIADPISLSVSVVAADPSAYSAVVTFEVVVDTSNGVPGSEGDDTLVGGSGDDFLSSIAGDDSLNGMSGNDRLVGGTGNDELRGGYGNDTFVFSLGDGVDTIETPYNDNYQFEETDTIEFSEGILPEDVQLLRDPTESMRLLINYGSNGDQIKVNNYFTPTELRYPIDFITFSNGVIWDSEEMRQRVEHVIDDGDNSVYIVKDRDTIDGLGGNDYIGGGVADDVLSGGSGDDRIVGKNGDDSLDGGLGNDSLSGGSGVNRMIFSALHGTDSIALTDADGTDVLVLDNSIDATALKYYRFGDDLVVGTSNGLANLSDYDMPTDTNNFIIAEELNGRYGLSTDINDRISIELSDLTTIALSNVTYNGVYLDLKNQSTIDDYLTSWSTEYGHIRESINKDFDYEFEGTSDDDVILGSNENDYITPSSGTDLIYSGDGNDEIRLGSGLNYVFSEAGDDIIFDSFGSDHIQGGKGNDVFHIESNSYLHFVEGDGNDLVQGNNYGTDNLVFIFPDDLNESSFVFTLSEDRTDIFLSWGAENDQIIFEDWLEVDDTSLELSKAMEIRFGDTLWSKSDVRSLILQQVNFAPIANDDDEFITEQDATLTIDSSSLLDNDTDLNGDLLTIESLSNSTSGSAILNEENNTIDFTPEAGFSGLASFEYEISDGEYQSQATVSITVNASNEEQPPADDEVDPNDYQFVVNGTENGEQLYYSNQDDYLSGLGGDDQLFGLDGNDYLSGGEGNDYLDGGNGDDIQHGDAGDDQLGGDAGNDLLVGGDGNDIYVFRPGNGQDTIDNSATVDGVDYLIFTDDITSDRLVYTRVGDDLLITISDSDDQVTILNWFLGGDYQIDYIQPSGAAGIPASEIEALLTDGGSSDGSGGSGGGTGEGDGNVDTPPDTWVEPSPSDYSNQKTGTENAEQIYFGNGNDYLEGLAGDDQIFGLDGNDYLSGGLDNDYLDGGNGDDIQYGGEGDDQLGGDAGNDLLLGGSGNDIYVFGAGAGVDVIDNSVGDDGVDWLILRDDWTEDVISYTRVGDDLKLSISGSTDQITIKNWFLGGSSQLDYIQPSGGSGIPAAQITSLAN